jgi:hypothetical protein
VHLDKLCLCCDAQAKTLEIQNIAETVFLEPKKKWYKCINICVRKSDSSSRIALSSRSKFVIFNNKKILCIILVIILQLLGLTFVQEYFHTHPSEN